MPVLGHPSRCRRHFLRGVKMEFNFFAATTRDLAEVGRINIEMADLLIARLKAKHPRNMDEFFPRSLSPVPDTEFAATFGEETLRDVIDAAEAVCIAMHAREELEVRRFPN